MDGDISQRWQRQVAAYKHAQSEIYHAVFPWWREAYGDATFPAYDKAAELACFARAAKEWREVTGLPPIDTANPHTWNAIVTAAGRPDKVGCVPSREAVSAVLAWAQAKFAEWQRTGTDSADKTDTKTDTPKKSARKTTRPLNADAAACALQYRKAKKADNSLRLRPFVEEWAATKGKSADSIYRALTDNPDAWKTDTERTR